MQSVTFFAHVSSPAFLDRVEFYAQDLRILRDLGFRVQIATKVSEIRPADFYFVWWWTWAFAPVAMAKLLRRPVIITGVMNHQRPDGVWELTARPFWQRWLIMNSARLASANVYLSELEHKMASNLFGRHARAHYIPCAIDTDLYHPGDGIIREKLVLTVAWMNPPNAKRKCIPQIVQAAALVHKVHPDARFVLAGDQASFGPELQRMIDAVDGGGYISCPGAISRDDKIALMRRSKIYLQPTYTEGFGLAIAEAMACGATVVTSAVGTVPEVAGDAAVYVDQNPAQIADAVIRLLSDDAERATKSEMGAKRIAERFSYQRRRSEMLALIQSVSTGTQFRPAPVGEP